jgi:hypothetical protein
VKYIFLALAIVLQMAVSAAAQNQSRMATYTLEQRRAMFERECRLMAPEAWRGAQKRSEWVASCRRETP